MSTNYNRQKKSRVMEQTFFMIKPDGVKQGGGSWRDFAVD